MWKDYSVSFIKKNRASSISIIVASFIATLFLSLLCSLFFNFWIYEIEKVILDEGDWQGRIIGELNDADLTTLQNFANVENIIINESLSENQNMVVDIYFKNISSIFRDLPLMTEKLGLEEASGTYHTLLLSKYMIHDPRDPEPPLLLTFYLFVLFIVSFSLILIIHNSFALAVNARVHQFGIFSSIGATPRQIRTCLIQEAALLCALPILIGGFIGIPLSYLIIQIINLFANSMASRHEAVFQYHPLIFIVTILVSIFTVLISAWLPARKLSRLTPLQAIRNTGEFQLKKKKNSRILSLFFGIEGELAGNALKAQKKALRTSTLSLTLSFLGFTLMLCFFTLSGISTNYTYFERYQNAWDVMVTLKNTNLEDFKQTDELLNLQIIKESLVYQKATATSLISKEWESDELNALGGLGAVSGTSVLSKDKVFEVKTPIVALDDASFISYCQKIGITPSLDGTIILNRLWDSINSNFRYPQYIPYLKEDLHSITLQNPEKDGNSVDLKVLGFTQEPPILREEYDDYALVQFIPLSLWNKISGQIKNAETDTYIRILAEEGVTLDQLNTLESNVSQLLSPSYTIETENRVQKRITNDLVQEGSMIILGSFCALLAIIGIANVFSNTLSFLRQRKREIAQYMSLGMTPKNLKIMFFIEALVISSRPFFITLPLTIFSIGFLIKASYLNPMEFLIKAPLIPIFLFILTIFLFVTLAYYIGGKRVLKHHLMDALRDDNIN